MLQIGIQLLGDDKVKKALDAALMSTSDLRPAYREAAKLIYKFVADNFKNEGRGSRSGKWQALSPRYAKYKARRWPGKLILERTGALKRSLTSPNSMGSRLVITKTSLAIGTTIPYSIYHQSTAPRRKLPRRPPLDMNAKQERLVAAALSRYLGLQSKKAGWTSIDLEQENPLAF